MSVKTKLDTKEKADTKDRKDELVKWILLNQSFGIAVISRKKESRMQIK